MYRRGARATQPDMKRSLDPGKQTAGQLRLIFQQLCTVASQAIDAYPSPDPEGIHTARKAIKRLRALLRLLPKRPLGKQRYTLNRALRESANLLRPYRDREVLLHNLTQWREPLRPTRSPVLCRALQTTQGSLQAGTPAPTGPAFENCRKVFKKRMRSTAQDLAKLDLHGLRGATLQKAYAQRCKHTQACRQQFLSDPSAAALHQWRKRCKDQYYQMQLLRHWLALSTQSIQRIQRLEQQLGDLRDYDLAWERTLALPKGALTLAERRSLRHYIDRQRNQAILSIVLTRN